jgi:hypothetical protein
MTLQGCRADPVSPALACFTLICFGETKGEKSGFARPEG